MEHSLLQMTGGRREKAKRDARASHCRGVAVIAIIASQIEAAL
jgi:hypothetical protein